MVNTSQTHYFLGGSVEISAYRTVLSRLLAESLSDEEFWEAAQDAALRVMTARARRGNRNRRLHREQQLREQRSEERGTLVNVVANQRRTQQ